MTEYSRFTLAGWEFIAYMPDRETDTQQWTVKITDPASNQSALYVGMDYAPTFGPDASDLYALNEAVDLFIVEHGIEEQ